MEADVGVEREEPRLGDPRDVGLCGHLDDQDPRPDPVDLRE